MRIKSIFIQNFRKLKQSRIDLSKETTVFVGANNSGKTSAMDALAKFLSDRSFTFNDFTFSNRTAINSIGEVWVNENPTIPEDITDWGHSLPTLDVWIDIEQTDLHHIISIIPTLSWRGGVLGVRLIYQPKEISRLFEDYRGEYLAARTTEASKPQNGTNGTTNLNLFPKNLSEFLDQKLNDYFSTRSYLLDPEHFEDMKPQPTSFQMSCTVDNPLRGIIKVDIIDAQRGLSDPDTPKYSERSSIQLSNQLRLYYDKHLDPEKLPTPDDYAVLQAAENARLEFDKSLAIKFEPAIKELESLGYPGLTDPQFTLTSKVSTGETLRHDSAVQYALNKNDETMKLPEKYNGLGYQNLISIVFDLLRFRDSWMRVGKASKGTAEDSIEPLHLVLVEEPEAHLHMQVQQVFIRKAYDVLQNHISIKDSNTFSTQLVISSHSSHIARELSFSALRYFKRFPECPDCNVATVKVINLSEIFGNGDNTDQFVTRYLQTTHCDLFYADAIILVEGSAESMLLPHFIRHHYPLLNHKYLSILSIN